MPLRTECAERGCIAPAVILLRSKLWCAGCAIKKHYPQHTKKKPTKEEK